MKNLLLLIIPIICLLGCGSEVQSQKMMDFFPATASTLAGVNVFSPKTADLKQYYVENGKWVHNKAVPSIKPTIKGGDYRMQYLPSPSGGAPNLLLYSTKSGEFVFYYLEEGMWKINNLLPGGKMDMKGDVRMEFTSGSPSSTAFMFAHSTNGKEMKVMEVQEGRWVYISYFPEKI